MNKKVFFLFLPLLFLIVLIGIFAVWGYDQETKSVPQSTEEKIDQKRSNRTAFLKGTEIWIDNGQKTEMFSGFSKASGVGGDSLNGTLEDILTSPDGRFVAFVNVDDAQVWSLNVDTLKAFPISSEGNFGQKNCPRTEIYLTGWSPDSQRFLYSVMYQGWDGMNPVEPPTCYPFTPGLHVADLVLKTSYPVQEKWLGENDYFVLFAKGQIPNDYLSHYFYKWVDEGVIFEQNKIIDQKTYDNGYILVDPDTGKRVDYRQ